MSTRSLKKTRGLDVFAGKGKRAGSVGHVLFGKTSKVIGFAVQRPPLLLLLERKDRYLALDRVQWASDGIHVSDSKDAWDGAAAKRLGINWDETVIWLGMPVRTVAGTQMGSIRDATFDDVTGTLAGLGLTGGMTADIALGVRDVPASLVKGFDGEAVVLTDEAAAVETDGGASAAAGRVAAAAKVHGGKAVEQAARAAGKAAAVGTAAVKNAVGPQPAKRAGRFLRALKDGVDRAISDDEDGK